MQYLRNLLHRPYDPEWRGIWWILWDSDYRSILLGIIIAIVLILVFL